VADPQTFTQEQVDAMVQEKLAAAKAEGDKAFSSLWDEAKAAKQKLKDYEGVDPNEYRSLKDKLTQLEQQAKAEKAGITSQELDRLRGEVRADLEAQYQPHITKAQQLAAENRALKLDSVVKAQMAQAGVRSERIDALYRLTADEFDLTDDGKPMVKSRMGTPVEKFVGEELVKQYPEFFAGSGSSGGGAPRSSGGAGTRAPTRISNDPASLLANIDRLAKGEVTVDPAA
jgi:hypothetical protein